MSVINLVGAAFAGSALAAAAARASVLDLQPLLPITSGPTRMVRSYGHSTSRYMPHQGPREIARRQRQANAGWSPIETAPHDRWIKIRVEDEPRPFIAQFASRQRTVDRNEVEGRGQWIAQYWCPDCWTDGACWASNHDEVPSLQPIQWQEAA